MSLLNAFRAKWKHPDPAVRENAVATLADQALLANLAENDDSENVRAAALKRLTDQSLLAQIAKGTGPLNARAAEALTDARALAGVARSAKSAEVRRLTVGRIEDRAALQLIATQDIDPGVRQLARTKTVVHNSLYDFLKSELSKLEIAERKAERVASLCGNLDDVCGALMKDGRFRINGVLGDETKVPPAAAPSAPPAEGSRAPGRTSVELLAGSHAPFGEANPAAMLEMYYHIKVSRLGQDEFDCSVEEKPSLIPGG